MDPFIGSFLLLFILLLFSGVFSGAETAIMSLEMSKIKSLKANNEKAATRVEWLKNHPQKVIITLLIMNNLLNTLITVLATVLAANMIGQGGNTEVLMGIVTLIISIFLIIFGDVLPKSIAVAHSQTYTFLVAPSISFLITVFTPFIFILEKLINLITPHSAQKVTEEEVLAMISMGEEHGEITKDERDQIENLLEFSETTVEEIMTPRTRLYALDEKTNFKDAKAFFIDCHHSRIPVYQDTIDSIVHIMTVRDILEEDMEGSDEKMIKQRDLKSPFFVPITKKISELLKEFQSRKTHIAVVVDEFGGTAGIVTMEDIFEEIFGEIRDETDEDEEEVIQKIDDNTWKISSRLTIDEVYEHTGLWIADSEDDYKKSISFFLLEWLERFPKKGEHIVFENCTLIIERVGNKTVETIRLIKKIHEK